MAKDKICVCCDTAYEYCGHCDDNAKINKWKNNYCSENCRDIFKTVTDYVGKLITIKEAKERLEKHNLKITTTKQVGKVIDEIISYKEPKKETPKVEEEQPKPKRRRRKKTTEE